MEYASNGNLLSYLDQNINKLTWRKKLNLVWGIVDYLKNIHGASLVHCDLHSGNIIAHVETEKQFQPCKLYICDLCLSRPVNSRESNSAIQGVLPFIAPEVFDTRKFAKESDMYSFGIIAHLVATGGPPFRDRQFDRDLGMRYYGRTTTDQQCLIRRRPVIKKLPNGVVMHGNFGCILTHLKRTGIPFIVMR